MNNKIYAGIGARNTPQQIQSFFIKIGMTFADSGWTLRSGGAKGADTAFELGCSYVEGKKEIYLPWKMWNSNPSPLYKIDEEAYKLAANFHPNWEALSPGAKKMIARDGYQILGKDLKTPVDFIICYTKEGKKVGGTAQALRIAEAYRIPVFNFGKYY